MSGGRRQQGDLGEQSARKVNKQGGGRKIRTRRRRRRRRRRESVIRAKLKKEREINSSRASEVAPLSPEWGSYRRQSPDELSHF